MRQTLREYVELAAGIAEQTGKRVVDTAGELLERAGVDVAAAERTVQTLAQEAVTVGRGGLDLAMGLARAEAEKAVERFGRLGDQVVKVGVVLAYLEGKLRDLEGADEAEPAAREHARGGTAPAGRADGLFAEDWAPEQEHEQEPEPGDEAPPAMVEPVVAAPAATEETDGTAAGRKTAARKTAAKKAATTRKATAGAKKTAAAEKATAEKTTAKKGAATKSAAAKKTTVKKTTAKKATAKKTGTTAKKVAAKPATDDADV
jgi:hypothetical protein